MSRPAVVYRIFDAAGVLLYIGRTMRLGLRLSEHRKAQPWWPEVANIDLALFDDADDAKREERRAILAEHPRHNKERLPVAATSRAPLLVWTPLPDDLKARIAVAARERSRTPVRSPGRDDQLAAVLYEALSLGCQPSPVANAAGLLADHIKRLSEKHLARHPELLPIPVRRSRQLAA